MKKTLTPTLGLLCLLLAGLSIVLWQKLRAAETIAASATREREQLNKRVADLENREKTLQSEAAALRQTGNGGRGRAVASAPGSSDVMSGPPAGGPMRALESPEMRRLMAIEQKARLDGRYASLFKALKLSPDQLEKFKQLLVDKQSAPMDVMSEARAQGLVGPDSRSQIQALLASTNQELDESIRASLGEAAYQQYQQYERTAPQRSLVDQLSSRLSYTDAPLSPQQSEQLISLLAAGTAASPVTANGPNTFTFSASAGPSGGPPIMIGGGGGMTVTNEAIALAQNLLSPAQVEALRQIQAEQQAQQQMGQVIRQSIGGPGGQRGPGTTTTIISGPNGTTSSSTGRE